LANQDLPGYLLAPGFRLLISRRILGEYQGCSPWLVSVAKLAKSCRGDLPVAPTFRALSPWQKFRDGNYTWRHKSPPYLNLEDLKDRKGPLFRFLCHNCRGSECAGIKRSKTFEVFEVFAVQFYVAHLCRRI
jgi:hypothetical protein